jgi:Flp pilus assembly protein TadD
VLFRKGRNDEAIRYLKNSIQLNPQNPDTFNNLGNAYLAKGDTDGAIEQYRHAVDLVKGKAGKHPDPFYNLGNALVKKGDLNGALDAFLEAEKQDADDPLIQNNLGFVYERKNSQDPPNNPISRAVEHYRKAADRQPDNAVFQRNLGLAARKQEGQGELATRALRRAVQLDPKDYNSHLALAEDYQNAHQIDASVREYLAAATVKPGEFVPHYNLGLLYARQAREAATPALRQQKYSLAISQLQQAQKLRVGDARALSALGWASFNAGNLKEAAAWYEKAVQADPKLQSAHANLGLVLERLHQPDEAVKHLKEAIRLDPKDSASHSLLASVYLANFRYAEAVAEYREVVRLDPKDARAYNNLGYCLEKVAKVDDAIAAYKQAIDLDPMLAVAYNNLGACYERQDHKDQAKQCYQKAHQLDPNLEDARRNLQRLGG